MIVPKDMDENYNIRKKKHYLFPQSCFKLVDRIKNQGFQQMRPGSPINYVN